jgi:hypothetical protein
MFGRDSVRAWPTPSMRHHTLVRTAFILLLPLLASVAMAQSYSVKELKRPFGAHGCFGPYALSDNGDVAVTCQYYSSFDFTIFQADYGLNKITVWRNSGAQQLLAQPSGYSSGYIMRIDRSGNVLTALRKTNNTGPVINTLWKGTTRTTLPLPAGLAGAWELLDMSPSGKVLAIKRGTAGKTASLAIFNGSTGQLLPTPPVAAGRLTLAYGATGAVNDAGQVALAEYIANDVVDTGRWFWDGAQWIHMSDAPVPSTPRVADINAQGEVLLVANLGGPEATASTWQASAGIAVLPITGILSIGSACLADNGDIVSGEQSSGSLSATLLSKGQLKNLNQLATLPAGVVLTNAVGLNARGQILTTAGGYPGTRMFLLTPK